MSESTTPDIQLELKERINYPNVLQTSMLNQKAIIKEKEFQLSKLHLMIMDDFYDIPNSWYDKRFAEDIKGVITEREVPNTVMYAGVPLSKNYMENHNIPLTIKVREIDYFKLKLAIRNLLDRLNMLIRKDKIEMSTGKNLEIESLDDIIEEMDSEENTDEET
jgi:hypothetical protein